MTILVSKETGAALVGGWKQKFGFIKRVDEGWVATVKGLESWRTQRAGYVIDDIFGDACKVVSDLSGSIGSWDLNCFRKST